MVVVYFANLISNVAQTFGVYSLAVFVFGDPIHEPSWVWIAGVASVAWLFVALFVLAWALFVFYTNLEKTNPVRQTIYYRGNELSREIISNLFLIEMLVFAIAITPGEVRRHKEGWDKQDYST